MDIQIRKQLEQLEYIKDKLEYIEYDEALGCYIEKQDGLPTGVAAWVNGAFYGFEQAAKAQANKQFEDFIDQAIEDSACADERRSLQVLLEDFQDNIEADKRQGQKRVSVNLEDL